jgi:GNAT superfamily N-acetyltransferase
MIAEDHRSQFPTDPNPESGGTPSSRRALAKLRIEPAAGADADLLSTLVHELAEFEELSRECTITPEAVREHLLGPQRSADALIAWLGEELAGFAVYYRTFSTFAARPGVFLEDLFVRPAFRHRGIGLALLKEVGRIAHCSGAARFEWITLKWNAKARALYGAAGARGMDEWLLLRMDAAALARFACNGSGKPHDGCRCGGHGPAHGHPKD